MIKIPGTNYRLISGLEAKNIANEYLQARAMLIEQSRSCASLMKLNETLALALDSIKCECGYADGIGEPLCDKCKAVESVAAVIAEHNLDGLHPG